MTRAAFSFRSRLDTIVVPKGDMHQSTLVRRHGTKLHAAVLTRRSIGGRTGDRLELLTLTTLVSFDVDNHRIAKPDGAVLKSAGYAFSDGSKRDWIVRYCLEHKIYNINQVNTLLFEYDQEQLGA